MNNTIAQFATSLFCVLLFCHASLAQIEMMEEMMPTGQATPREFVILNDTLYFVASARDNNNDVFIGIHRFDGDIFSVALNAYSLEDGMNPHNLIIYNGAIYFRWGEGENEYDLYRLEGNTAYVVSDHDWQNGTFYTQEIVFNGKLYFTARHPSYGPTLWSYDGTTASLAIDPSVYNLSTPKDLFVFDNELYFSADDQVHGHELWKFDGDTAVLAYDILPGSSSSLPGNFIEFQSKLYFSAADNDHGMELWCYDGDTAYLAADIAPGIESSNPYRKVVYNGLLYAAATATGSSFDGRLWSFDGTTATQIATMVDVAYPNFFAHYAGKLYMSGQTSNFGRELWSFNGTTAYMEADINHTTGHSLPTDITTYKDRIYFAAQDDDHNMELWRFNDIDVCERAQAIEIHPECEPVASDVANMEQSLPGCDGTANEDVWFSFTPNYQTSVIEVTGSVLFDAVVELFEGSCGDLHSLACVNQTGQGEPERVNVSNLDQNETYYLRVYEYGAAIPTTLTFELCFAVDEEANAISEIEVEQGIVAYPNPTSDGVVQFASDKLSGYESIRVYDSMGKLVEQGSLQGQLPVNFIIHAEAGLYLIRITHQSGTETEVRVVKS